MCTSSNLKALSFFFFKKKSSCYFLQNVFFLDQYYFRDEKVASNQRYRWIILSLLVTTISNCIVECNPHHQAFFKQKVL